VIALSYEIADRRKQRQGEPSTGEALAYLCSYTGLFTGPYFTYQTYADSTHCQRVSGAATSTLVAEKLRRLLWTMPLFVALSWLNPIEALRGEQVETTGVLKLLLLSALAFAHLRMRIYSAWMMAESILIVAGIGVYPKGSRPEPGRGPTIKKEEDAPGEWSAEAISNLDIASIEWSDGFRSGMRAWNRWVAAGAGRIWGKQRPPKYAPGGCL